MRIKALLARRLLDDGKMAGEVAKTFEVHAQGDDLSDNSSRKGLC